MVSADTQHPQSNPQTPAPQTEYCPACQQDLRKLRESARITTALRELAEQMEGFDLP